MSSFFSIGAYLLFGILSLFMIATATSAGFAIHGVIILIACILAVATTVGRLQPAAEGGWLVPTLPFDDTRLKALKRALAL